MSKWFEQTLHKTDICMANKNREGCSTALAIMKMLIKTTTGHYHKPSTIVNMRKTDGASCWHEGGTSGTLMHYSWQFKMVQSHGRIFWPRNCTLRYLPKRNENVFIKIFDINILEALLVVAKRWKNPNAHQKIKR